MDVMNGDKGETGDDGLGIKSVDINAQNHLIVTYDDDTTHDAGELPGGTGEVVSVNGKKGIVVLDASDVGALADDTEIPTKTSDLTNDSIVDSASYDSANHQILFKNGTTTLFSLDAAAFVKDGMVDDVEISGGNLVITFNTDAGKQAISIPLTDIFDPANYYDKDDVDGLLGDKADKVESATNGNFAGLDANGNLKDSGKKASDFGTADEIADIVNVYGAKNLIPYPWNQTTKTSGGVTWTDNGDGSLTVNGTNTTAGNQWFFFTDEFSVKAGEYILSVTVPVVDGTTVSFIDDATNTYYANITSGQSEAVARIPNDLTDVKIGIRMASNKTVSNYTFSIMLRLASIEDDTYVPYVSTNAKLDEVKVSYTDASKSVQKNLNSYPYHETTKTLNGITFTDLGDGTIKVNGTATAYANYFCHNRLTGEKNDLILPNGKYILNGCPSNAPTNCRIDTNITKNGVAVNIGADSGNGVELNLTGDDYSANDTNLGIIISVSSGVTVDNLIFKPMIRKATIKDDTWQPYIHNNTELVSWKDNGVLGAKNLLQNTATTQTINNVAFTVNSDDKTVKVTRTAEQTEIATRDLYVVSDEDYKLLAGKTLLMTGCPSGGSNDTYYLECYYNDGTGHWLRDVGNGLKITLPTTKPTTIKFLIGIKVASVIPSGGLTFKPMLRLASDPDDTYQPYAMTNKELTEEVNALPREVFVTTDTRTTTTNDANTLPCGFTRMNDENDNLPTDGTGGSVWYDILTVRQSNDSSKATWGYGFQLAVQTTTNANMGDMYVRAVNGGETPTWSAWRKLN